MNNSPCDQPNIARYARNITRLTRHLVISLHLLAEETNETVLERESENVTFILKKMRRYVRSIRATCNRLNIPDVQKIVIAAIRAGK